MKNKTFKKFLTFFLYTYCISIFIILLCSWAFHFSPNTKSNFMLIALFIDLLITTLYANKLRKDN